MSRYKRNQVEESLAVFFRDAAGKPIAEFSSRLKRLLDTDRGLGRNPRSANSELSNYAFFSQKPPGKGVEILFSDYEAFALLVGLRLLQHGWPQGFVVGLLRRERPDLELEHTRTLRLDPKSLFDQKAIVAKAKPGQFYVDNTDPIFLVLGSGAETCDEVQAAVSRGMEETFKFMKSHAAQSWSMHELVTPAHSLAAALSEAEPRARGRQK